MAEQKKLKVFIASNVGMDYFFFLGKTLAANGTEVEPIFLVKEQDYRFAAKNKGFKKIYLRIQMYVFYPLMLVCKAITSPKNSIFIVTSNTFFAPVLTKFFVSWRKIKVVHLLYDLYPDAIEIAGAIKQNGLLAKAIGKITKANFKYCNGTVYLGEFLKSHAETRWLKPNSSDVIHISTDLSLYDNTFPELSVDGKIIIHYGGQLGHLHDANSIIKCIKFLFESDLKNEFEFNFYLSGAQAQFLQDSLKDYPIKIIPAVNSSVWREDIKNYHIGLVTLLPGGATVCLPSKTYGMMAGGLAILAICPSWSDLGNLVLENNAGWIVNNSSYNSIDFNAANYLQQIKELKQIEKMQEDFYKTLKSIVENKEIIKQKRSNAFTCVREKYNSQILNNQWISCLNESNP